MTNTTYLAATLAALLLLPGVARADDKKTPKPAPPVADVEQEKRGRLLVVRGLREGEPQFTDADGSRYLLTGKWRGELLRLDGHVVKIWGKPGEKKLMTPTLTVSRYEILSAGYGTPIVGKLQQTPGGGGSFTLVQAGTEPALKLTGSASMQRKLRKRLGCKIWFVGRKPVKGVTRVRIFGWLSCEQAPADKPGKLNADNKPGPKATEKSPEPKGSKEKK